MNHVLICHLELRMAGDRSQLAQVSKWQHGNVDLCSLSPPSTIATRELLGFLLFRDFCSKHISCFLGSCIFSDPTRWFGQSRKNSELKEPGKDTPSFQTLLLFSDFFFPRGIWQGPSHLRGLTSRNWNQATGSPFWSKERAQLSIPAPRLGLPNICCRIKRGKEKRCWIEFATIWSQSRDQRQPSAPWARSLFHWAGGKGTADFSKQEGSSYCDSNLVKWSPG